MKYTCYLLLLLCVNTFTQTKVDSFYVRTEYEQILDQGRLTYTKKPINQKTFNKQGVLIREVDYDKNTSVETSEQYFHYKENTNYLIEKYSNRILVAYTYKVYKKDNLKQSSYFKIINGESILEYLIKYKNKKGIYTVNKYSSDKKLIYSLNRDETSKSLTTIKEEFFNSDSILSRTTLEYFSDSLNNIDKTIIITNYTNNSDTITNKYSYTEKNQIDNIITTSTLNKSEIKTRYIYFAKGEIKKYYSVDNKGLYTEYREYNLKKYYRNIPFIEPVYKLK